MRRLMLAALMGLGLLAGTAATAPLRAAPVAGAVPVLDGTPLVPVQYRRYYGPPRPYYRPPPPYYRRHYGPPPRPYYRPPPPPPRYDRRYYGPPRGYYR